MQASDRADPGAHLSFDRVPHHRTRTREEIGFVGPGPGGVCIESEHVDGSWRRDALTLRAPRWRGMVATRLELDLANPESRRGGACAARVDDRAQVGVSTHQDGRYAPAVSPGDGLGLDSRHRSHDSCHRRRRSAMATHGVTSYTTSVQNCTYMAESDLAADDKERGHEAHADPARRN